MFRRSYSRITWCFCATMNFIDLMTGIERYVCFLTLSQITNSMELHPTTPSTSRDIACYCQDGGIWPACCLSCHTNTHRTVLTINTMRLSTTYRRYRSDNTALYTCLLILEQCIPVCHRNIIQHFYRPVVFCFTSKMVLLEWTAEWDIPFYKTNFTCICVFILWFCCIVQLLKQDFLRCPLASISIFLTWSS